MNARRIRDYALVSGCCLLLNNGVLILMDRSGSPLPLSTAVSFAVVVVVGYALHAGFTFRSAFGTAAFGRYAAAMSANVPLALATLWLWRDLVGLPMPFAAPLGTVCTAVLNFALCRFVVFGRAPAPAELSVRP